MIKFTVLGEPVVQGRPRAGIRNGKISMRDPMKSRNFKQYVGLVASQYAPEKLLEGPLQLEVKVYKPSLKSFLEEESISGRRRVIETDNKARR